MRCMRLPPLNPLHGIHYIKIKLWEQEILCSVVELDGREQVLQVGVRGCDGHEFQEWDKAACCCWAVLQAKVDTEEEPSPHTGYHILGSALGKSM